MHALAQDPSGEEGDTGEQSKTQHVWQLHNWGQRYGSRLSWCWSVVVLRDAAAESIADANQPIFIRISNPTILEAVKMIVVETLGIYNST